MKLYTEEQVKALCIKSNQIGNLLNRELNMRDLFNQTTPIELPSDEGVEKQIDIIMSSKNNNDEKIAISAGFKLGYYWMREQIKQQAE